MEKLTTNVHKDFPILASAIQQLSGLAEKQDTKLKDSGTHKGLLYEGVLEKEGGNVKSWKTRHFKLFRTHLEYGTQEKQGTKILGRITLTPDVIVLEDSERGMPFCFVISTKDRNYYVKAKTKYLMNTWIQKCNEVLEQFAQSPRGKPKSQSPMQEKPLTPVAQEKVMSPKPSKEVNRLSLPAKFNIPKLPLMDFSSKTDEDEVIRVTYTPREIKEELPAKQASFVEKHEKNKVRRRAIIDTTKELVITSPRGQAKVPVMDNYFAPVTESTLMDEMPMDFTLDDDEEEVMNNLLVGNAATMAKGLSKAASVKNMQLALKQSTSAAQQQSAQETLPITPEKQPPQQPEAPIPEPATAPSTTLTSPHPLPQSNVQDEVKINEWKLMRIVNNDIVPAVVCWQYFSLLF